MASESTELADLKQARANYAGLLKQLTQDALGNPQAKPTYSLDGKSVSWMEYQGFIMDKMDMLEKMIQRASARGGFEVRSRAVSN